MEISVVSSSSPFLGWAWTFQGGSSNDLHPRPLQGAVDEAVELSQILEGFRPKNLGGSG